MSRVSLRSKAGITIFFALMAIVIVGYILFPRGHTPLSSELISVSSEDHIVRIEIAQNGDPHEVVLERADSGWKLVLDAEHKNSARKDKVAALITSLTQKNKLISVGHISEDKIGIGIEGSFFVRIFADNATNPTTLFFGNTDATGKWIYVKSEAVRQISRTPSGLADFLDIRAASWATLSPYSGLLEHTGIQRIIYTQNGSTKQLLAGKDEAVAKFESALASMECLDVTNLNSIETESIEIEFGDLHKTKLGLAPFDDVWILSDSETGGSYIISDATKQMIDKTLGSN